MNMFIQAAVSALPKSLQRVCRRCAHYRRKHSWQQRTIKQDVFGYRINVILADRIAERWYGRPVSILPAVQYFFSESSMVRKDALIFYIGAHHSVYAIGISRIMEDRCRIIAIEGNPDHASIAMRNINANAMTNITVDAKAIADRKGVLDFTLGHSVWNGNRSIPSVKVPATTIDSLSEQYGVPDLVILDVEGFEAKAMRGASRTLDSNVSWCVEVHSNCGLQSFGGTVEEIVDSFRSRGYHLLMCRDYGGDTPVVFQYSSPLVHERFHLLAVPATV